MGKSPAHHHPKALTCETVPPAQHCLSSRPHAVLIKSKVLGAMFPQVLPPQGMARALGGPRPSPFSPRGDCHLPGTTQLRFPKPKPLKQSLNRAATPERRSWARGTEGPRSLHLRGEQSGPLGCFGTRLSTPACHRAAGPQPVSSDQISPSQFQSTFLNCHASPAGSTPPCRWIMRREQVRTRGRQGETAGSGEGLHGVFPQPDKSPFPNPRQSPFRARKRSTWRGGMGLPGAPSSQGWPLSSPHKSTSATRELCVGKAALQPRVLARGCRIRPQSRHPLCVEADLSHSVLSVSCQRSRGRLLPKRSPKKRREKHQSWLQHRQRGLQVARKNNRAR